MTRPFAPFLRFALAVAAVALAAGAGAAQLQSAGATLAIDQERMRIARNGQTVLDLDAIGFDYQRPLALEILSANDQRIQIELTYPTSVDFYRKPDDLSPRFAQLEISVVPGGFRFYAHPDWSNQTTLHLDYLDDSVFGLTSPLQPDNRLTPNLAGSSVDVEVKSEGETIVENYASAFSAFYLSSLGYGSFFDTFARGSYDIGINGRSRIHHDTGELDWYLFFGDDGVEIHRHYFALIGDPKPLPLWGLGPVGWRDHNESAEQILDDIRRFTDLRIPLTAWFVDRPYSDGAHAWSEMNFSESFANPSDWIRAIRDDFGLEFMTWTSTAMFGAERFPRHLEGRFTYLDLSHPPTVAQYQQELARKQYAHGVRGHKMDRADELFPVYEEWHKNVPPAARRNTYAYLFSKVHHDALQEAWGHDQINFARAAIHRVQPFLSALWGGDPRSNWEGLQSNIANGLRASFMGFPVWGTDVGGYLGEGFIDQELYVRWLQAGSMNGFFEIKLDGAGGEGRDRMPWRYDSFLQDAFRSVCQDRMRLLPYLYSLSHTAEKTGVLMQPMAYRHFDDRATHAIWDQFYLGDAILAAPVLAPGNLRSVYLPAGVWHNFDAPNERIELTRGEWRSIDVPLDVLPRWIPANRILVTGSIRPGNAQRWNEHAPNLDILAIPGSTGTSHEFEYIDALDRNASKPIRMRRDADRVSLSLPAIDYPCRLSVFADGAPRSVSLDGAPIPFNYDRERKLAFLDLPLDQDVTVQFLLNH